MIPPSLKQRLLVQSICRQYFFNCSPQWLKMSLFQCSHPFLLLKKCTTITRILRHQQGRQILMMTDGCVFAVLDGVQNQKGAHVIDGGVGGATHLNTTQRKMMMVEVGRLQQRRKGDQKEYYSSNSSNCTHCKQRKNSPTPMGQVNVGGRSVTRMDISPMAGQGYYEACWGPSQQ